MFFVNASFLGSADSIMVTPTNVDNITYTQYTNAIYDEILVTNDVDFDESNESSIPREWNSDTIFYTSFLNGTKASNIDYLTDTIDNIVIKRREEGTHKWTTIAVYPINQSEDIDIKDGRDLFAGSDRTYEYALVPSYNGQEGTYYIAKVKSEFDGIFLAEKGKIYGTQIGTDGEYVRNAPSTVVELINQVYPKYVSNSIATYDSGSATADFTQFVDCDSSSGGYYDIDEGWRWRHELLEFLTDRKPKILKDGRGPIWLVNIINAPSNAPDDIRRVISFEWVEIGDYKSEKDLYMAGLSDISSEWWSNN